MKHYLSVEGLSRDELVSLLQLGRRLKDEWIEGGNEPILQGKTLGMVFQKPSLRTRVSFDMGMLHLGGHALYLSPQEVGLGSRESVADVARVLSRYVDGIMARVFAHEHILGLAEYSSVPVINGLSDFSHPCQALADVFTIWEALGRLEEITVAYVGDSNNVARSLTEAGVLLGWEMRLASPPDYTLSEEDQQRASTLAERNNGSIAMFTDPQSAVAGADIIYTDVWTSMGQEEERERRLRTFPPYQVNQALVDAAGNAEVRVMHCLPAHRGEEITDEVADGPHTLLFVQAENRMHAQKALLARLLGGVPLVA